MISVAMPQWSVLVPELILLVSTCMLLLLSTYRLETGSQPSESSMEPYIYRGSQLALVAVLVSLLCLWSHKAIATFHNSFILDPLALVLKAMLCILGLLLFTYARHYARKYDFPVGAYYALMLFAMLGMMILVSAGNLLTVFLGLELASLPVYALVAMRRDAPLCLEAAVKYFVMGALATGILLYGFSLLYGVSASLDLLTIAHVVQQATASQSFLFACALVFVVVGLAFKLGLVPFHMWIPDVYEGAPTPIALFIATVSKIAAFGMVLRVLGNGLVGLHPQWQQLFIVLAVLSIAGGNLAAVMQTQIKRLLAYSSIAHMGYMILGILVGTELGYGASLFYVMTYTVMTAGAFGWLLVLEETPCATESIPGLRGLSQQSPWMALIMLIFMFSMAGVPPLVGFMAKLAVLKVLVTQHLVWLAVFTMLFALVGAYYYLRVIKAMYFEGDQEAAKPIATHTQAAVHPLTCSWESKALLLANGMAVLALGVFPGPLFHLCQSVF